MRTLASLALLIPFGLSCCGDPASRGPFQLVITVVSDAGKVVPRASISRANKVLGATDAAGRSVLTIGGDAVEGEIMDLVVTCPEGYLSPSKALSVRLTRLADKNNLPEYVVQCPSSIRRVVVAVRAENGPNLPVMYLDRLVTRTDAAGAASFALEMPPGFQFTVALSTAERKDIKPINPSRQFVVNHQDEIFLFDQKFDVEKKAPAPAVRFQRAHK